MPIPVWDIAGNRIRRPGLNDLSIAVYTLIQLLGVGEVTSYGDLAMLLGVSPRLIGRILSMNRDIVVIPCHRVVKRDLGVGGYSLGTSFKRELLRLEGSLADEDRVRRDCYRSLYELLLDP